MPTSRTLALLGMVLAMAPVALWGSGNIPDADDFHRDGGEAAESHKPIVVMVSAVDCPYCEALKDNIFVGMERDHRIILRELNMDNPTRLVDFERKVTDHQSFAGGRGLNFAPTVLFLDGKGRALAEPIVGIGNLDFYSHYLEKRIEQSRRILTRAD